MSASDDYLRRHRNRPSHEEPEEAPTKVAPLASQEARSGGFPRREVTPDDLIRAVAGRSSAPGGWARIF